MNEQSGVVYAAKGAPYLLETLISASQVKRWHPDVPVVLYTESQGEGMSRIDELGFVDSVQTLETQSNGTFNPRGTDASGYLLKILAMLKSPFEKTIYLDTDTLIVQPCLDSLFSSLNHCDIAAAHQAWRPDASGGNPVLCEMNTGVLGFTKAANTILEQWRDAFTKLEYGLPNSADQLYFRDVIEKNIASIRLQILPGEFNKRPHFSSRNDYYIIHSHKQMYQLPSQETCRRLVDSMTRLLPFFRSEKSFFLEKVELLASAGHWDLSESLLQAMSSAYPEDSGIRRTQVSLKRARRRKTFCGPIDSLIVSCSNRVRSLLTGLGGLRN